MGGLEFVVVITLLVGGIDQSFLNSKRFRDIFPALGQGVLVQTVVSSNGGGCSPVCFLAKASGLESLLGH